MSRQCFPISVISGGLGRAILPILSIVFFFAGVTGAGGAPRVVDIVRITGPVMDVDNPSFSPDGEWIAVSNITVDEEGAEADELWVISPSSGATRKLLDSETLKSHGSQIGYSIWNIRWKSGDAITFSLSDNEVRYREVTISTQPLSLPEFGEWKDSEYETPPAMPAGLKMFLLMHYPEDSAKREHLVDHASWFEFVEHEGRWYVHHLNDTYVLVVDAEEGEAEEAVISRNKVGDTLEFHKAHGRLLAVYSVPRKSMRGEGVDWHYVDEIVPGGKSKNLFRVRGYPALKPVGDSELFVYGRVPIYYPYYRMEVMHYTFGGRLREIKTDSWHNADFSADGKRAAFIQVIDGMRVLFTGRIEK